MRSLFPGNDRVSRGVVHRMREAYLGGVARAILSRHKTNAGLSPLFFDLEIMGAEESRECLDDGFLQRKTGRDKGDGVGMLFE